MWRDTLYWKKEKKHWKDKIREIFVSVIHPINHITLDVYANTCSMLYLTKKMLKNKRKGNVNQVLYIIVTINLIHQNLILSTYQFNNLLLQLQISYSLKFSTCMPLHVLNRIQKKQTFNIVQGLKKVQGLNKSNWKQKSTIRIFIFLSN